MQGMDKVSQAAEYAEVECPLVHSNKQHSNIHHHYSNIQHIHSNIQYLLNH